MGAFRSGHPLERMVAIRQVTQKPVAGLPTQVVNDKGRYLQESDTAICVTFLRSRNSGSG
jgi:hypothetical protein